MACPLSHMPAWSRRFLLARIFFVLLAPVACDRDPKDPEADRSADEIRVPRDHPTLQEAIDGAKSGSTILVADGVYTGEGNRDLSFHGESLTLRSENGAARTIIDCEGAVKDPHSGFLFREGDRPVIEGFTIRGGFAAAGAGVHCEGGSPIFRDCLLAGNTALTSGGALRCKSASPRFIRCTFARNAAPAGGGAFLIAQSSPVFEQCLFAFSTQGTAVFVNDGTCRPTFLCCDIYGNEGGDWVGDLEAQADSGGNFSLDPLFCNASGGDYRLRAGSPCLAEGSPCDEPVGALGAGCP